ncbi:MAG: hypothetical protein CUN55_12555 [Phototrophicales bacterium]|nr:MAG: hypothetical protein CUN55_12555 [Phototrophicales bacterium]
MSDPLRKLSQAERQLNNVVRAPQRQMRGAERQARNIARMPARNARMVRNQAQQLRNLPGQKARRMRNAVGRPMRGIKNNLDYMSGAVPKKYKRKADRMSGTDLSISAMMYPMAWVLTPIAGFVADWDTAFIKYHVAHARWMGLFAFFFLPIIFVAVLINPVIAIVPLVILMLFWFYMWYLGFKAYGGQLVIVPLLTNMLIRRNAIDIVTIEAMMGGAQPQDVRVHYNPNAR